MLCRHYELSCSYWSHVTQDGCHKLFSSCSSTLISCRQCAQACTAVLVPATLRCLATWSLTESMPGELCKCEFNLTPNIFTHMQHVSKLYVNQHRVHERSTCKTHCTQLQYSQRRTSTVETDYNQYTRSRTPHISHPTQLHIWSLLPPHFPQPIATYPYPHIAQPCTTSYFCT